MKRIAIVALSALTLPAAAFAGGPVEVAPEMAIEAPAPMVVAAPVGDWTGFYVGAQLGYGKVKSGGAGLDGEGAIGGVNAGYRWQMGRAVLGAELDYNRANIDLGTTGDSLDSVTRLKLSAGTTFGNALVYVTAGPAYADATLADAKASDNGYFAGLGMDYAISDKWTVGGEVLAHKFDNFNDTGVDLEATTVQAKVGYRF